MRSILSFAVIAIALPLADPSAFSQDIAQPSAVKGDISGFHGTTQSLPDAISKIERATGGKVVEIRFSDADNMPGYHAVVAKNGQVQFMHLEAQSGRLVTVRDNTLPVWMLSWRGQAELRVAENAPVPLSEAVKTAEQADNNAPAIAAGVARSASSPANDVHAYNILMDRGGSVQRSAVDSATNQVIADAGSLSQWP
jgi:uncharacterized membrane protein YkoI